MDKYLDTFTLPSVNKEELETISRPIRMADVETVIKSLSTKKSSGPDRFTAKFYQT